jgi:hypothetical protein
MQTHSNLLQGLIIEPIVELINKEIRNQLQELKKDLLTKEANDELLTRKETCEFLKINSSSLWAWTKKGKVLSYGIANRRYYKRSELMDSLKLVKR